MLQLIKDIFGVIAGVFSMVTNLLTMMSSGLSELNRELEKTNNERELKMLKAERERILKQIDGHVPTSRISTDDKSKN
jgi:hypothetical protein